MCRRRFRRRFEENGAHAGETALQLDVADLRRLQQNAQQPII